MQGRALADLVAALPPCFVARDLVRDIDPARARMFLSDLNDPASQSVFFAETGSISGVDPTDGLRFDFENGAVVHLRPSGNAPEFRLYAQGPSPQAAQALVDLYLPKVAARAV